MCRKLLKKGQPAIPACARLLRVTQPSGACIEESFGFRMLVYMLSVYIKD